ncbi:Imm1 family immunity protein [Kitasatospora sp. NPDC059146]|uniref:Imm1 family immunity protein n=1 Tax=unclassified Kitasatospora TaxID=2633591 RepID=UPI00369AC513
MEADMPVEGIKSNYKVIPVAGDAKSIQARYRKGHGKNPVVITSLDEVDAFIDDLLDGESDYNTLAEVYSQDREVTALGFPDHQLMVCASKSLGLGLVSYMDANGNFTSLGSPETRTKPTYHFVWNTTQFADHSEIPIPLLRQAVKEFLISGGRQPTCLEWQPETFGA